MPRKKSLNLTEAELRLMNVLWDKGSSTVGDVVEALTEAPPLAYSTVLTTLRILETKGYLRHTKTGRAYVYETLVDRNEARSNAVRYLVSRFFGNSPELLMQNIVENETIGAKELERLKKMIAESGQ